MKPRALPHTPTCSTPFEVLKNYWGYDSFRPMQEEIISSILEGCDTLALMPTGGGKSITFQVPALLKRGICIVITPLVALMKDQVDRLKDLGIKATYLHSGLSRSQALTLLDNCLFGEYKFLYVSPERLENETFLMRLSSLEVSFIVVDESHCVCQWGYDFRPSYLRISTFREYLPDIPILALTATATNAVVQDIREKLLFREGARIFKRSFYRKNLSYVVRQCTDKPRELLHILSRVEGSALIYVRSRKRTKEYAELLQHWGISAEYYHAGLSAESKAKKQNLWQQGEVRVMVCTTAFGMGIDKNDVRLVIHPEPPAEPESYYQEAGRAGRDNKPAYAILLFDPKNDPERLRRQLSNSFPTKEFIQKVYDSLCNYFSIALGHGEREMHELNMYLFCSSFKLSPFQTHSALGILTNAGVLQYLEDHTFSSRFIFLVGRNELYSIFDDTERKYDDLVEVLLRMYTGVFTEYVFIDEEKISHALSMSREELYHRLINMTKWHIIDYIPGKRSNYVKFLTPRMKSKKLPLEDRVYEERKRSQAKRVEKMLGYIEEQRECRVKRLLEYFGEKEPKPCGLCDVCRHRALSKPSEELSYYDIDRVEVILEKRFRQEGVVQVAEKDLAQECHLSLDHLREALLFLEAEGHPYEVDQAGWVFAPSLTPHPSGESTLCAQRDTK